jgi:hypothetical protein
LGYRLDCGREKETELRVKVVVSSQVAERTEARIAEAKVRSILNSSLVIGAQGGLVFRSRQGSHGEMRSEWEGEEAAKEQAVVEPWWLAWSTRCEGERLCDCSSRLSRGAQLNARRFGCLYHA